MSTARTITARLTYADLSTIHGWANFVRHSPGEDGPTGWDAEDERVRSLVYELLHPFLAPCLADLLDRQVSQDTERYGHVAAWR